MEVKTKYAVAQNVWVRGKYGEPECVKVDACRVTITESKIAIYYDFYIGEASFSYPEQYVYATKAELN